MIATRSAELNRTCPFIADSRRSDCRTFLLDRFELPLGGVSSEIWAKIRGSLDLRLFGPLLEPEAMTVLIEEQFAAAEEFVYGHPIWEEIRCGNQAAVYAYLLETRHYLAAASARMSPSIDRQLGLSPLNLLLSKHLLEEWDHAKFYGRALTEIGCPRELIAAARPMPTTLEWIHVTRQIGYVSGLNAALCSGFMVFSSVEIDAVMGWHDMLVSEGLLPPEANAAIVGHVDTDTAFGHADNWRRALAEHGPLRATEAAKALNSVATLAETIYRWLSSLREGLAGLVVHGMQALTQQEMANNPEADFAERELMTVGIYDGLPVWPSELMRIVTWGDPALPAGGAIITGLTYALAASDSPLPAGVLTDLVRDNASQLVPTAGPEAYNTVDSIDQLATSWLRSIDGHELWTAMAEDPSDALIAGYVLENYHYLGSAASHIGAAIASTTSGEVRRLLIAHLEDELTHCRMLERKLIDLAGIQQPMAMRPLSTTVAFVGLLQNLAHQDWKAYLVASTYLQRSLSETRPTDRGSRFYHEIGRQSRHGAELLAALRDHDEIDENLGHDERPTARLIELVAHGPVPADCVRHAAMAPALAWGFLDGILRHYRAGPISVNQRIAWSG